MPLGDTVERALAAAGVTPTLVERWVGAPCGCPERQEKLNQLGYWAARVIAGRTARAAAYLRGIIGNGE